MAVGGRSLHPWSPQSLLVLVLLFAGLLAIRLPFLDQTLIGEEGCFAYLAVENGRPFTAGSGEVLLVGRIDDRDLFCAPEHPILPYALLRALRPLSGDGRDFARLSLAERSRRARLPFLVMSAIAIGLLLFVVRTAVIAGSSSWLPLGLVAFIATTPLLVGGSIQAQLDGAFGVLLVQTSATCLFLAARGPERRRSAALLVVGGALAGSGKNEWALAFLGAVCAALVAACALGALRRDGAAGRGLPWRPALWLLVGLAAGSLVSFLLDPANYLGGLHVMGRIQCAGGDWSDTFRRRLPHLWPLAPLVVLGAVAAWRLRRFLGAQGFGIAVVLSWGFALTLGFLLTSWNGDGLPRYFCPPAFALLASAVVLWPGLRVPPRLAGSLVVALSLGVGANVVSLLREHRQGRSITSSPGLRVSELEARWRSLLERASPGQHVTADSAFGYYFPESSFLSGEVREEDARELIQKAGRVHSR